MSTVTDHVELPITGMTCASCANRIERKLNKLDGVTATVNYATERATVDYDAEAVEPAQLVAAVEAAGYAASLPEAAAGPEDELAALRRRLLVSLALMLPILAMAMIPPLQFESWQWLSLTLAAPVVVWGALPFHRAAWANLRHATATMDTLISVGVRGIVIAVGSGQHGLIAGRLHRRDQLLGGDRIGVIVDGRLLGGVVDRRGHAVELVELALDAIRARGAGHAGDRQLSGRHVRRPPR